MSERLPGRRGTGAKPTIPPGPRRASKKSTSALGTLSRTGRAVPIGPMGTAPAFTAAAGRAVASKGPKPLSASDRKLVASAKAAKRPTAAQRDVLAAAATRKAAANARRSSTLKANAARRKKMAGLSAAGKVSTGKYVPKGPR